jgi:hypothetical protein
MNDCWPTRIGLSVILAGAIFLAGCSGLPALPANAAPATVAYMNGSSYTGIVGYSTVPADNGSSIGTLTLPPSPLYYGGPLATDPGGQIYVATADGTSHAAQILIYLPNSTGAAAPSRTINIIDVNRLAVDPAGRVYVLNLAGDLGAPTVSVYSADSSGSATPFRTLVLTNVLPPVADIAADAAGNLYVAAYIGNSWTVAVYPPTAAGPSMPTRTIDFGAYGTSIVYGVAVDSAGDIFANVASSSYNGPRAIEEFAPGSNGSPTPINTINLTVGTPWQIIGGGPVRIDGAGNIFTSLQLLSHETALNSIVIYGFGPTATGNAAPTVQIAPADGGYNTFFALN